MQKGNRLSFVFGGQRYGDILVPSGGQRWGKKFCGLKLTYIMHKDSVRTSQRTLLHKKEALLNAA